MIVFHLHESSHTGVKPYQYKTSLNLLTILFVPGIAGVFDRLIGISIFKILGFLKLSQEISKLFASVSICPNFFNEWKFFSP